MTALEFKKINDAIRVWNKMGFRVETGVNNFTLLENNTNSEYDSFRNGDELYTAAVYYQQGYFHAQLDVKQ